VQRLDAEVVARAERAPLLPVPDHEREHAAQPGEHLLAPVVVAGDDRLAVTLRAELGAEVARQLLAQLDVVVDLAVEGQQVAPIGVRQRLVAQRHVDDRQPLVREDRVRSAVRAGVRPGVPDDLDARFVRTAVVQALQGAGDGVAVRLRAAAGAEEREQSAHGGHLSTR
jgi:hypothetical protein